ncbi:uncharacterized protein LOC131250647 [Magnolia sinica]|uniref:uncharacterized protein LOC131250647 n=1 Tax=Magnolia sinica TaxID=86752 RepID=UPI00265AA436|nr:uncharacterized protein LOC131250647 [Magnolia sinica]
MNFLTPLKSVLEFLWEPVAQRIGYVKNLESNFEKLNDEARDLYNRRDDVKLEIRRSKTEKIPTNECKGWLEKVEKIENKLNEIAEEYKEDKKCLIGCCPDVYSSMKLGERVQNMISNVIDLKKKSKFEGGIVVNAPLVKAGMMLAPTIEIETSSDRTLKNIVRCIEDVRIKKIGIWGMGGVGKTTVMQNLRCHPTVTRMFEIVIWVAVSKDWSTRKVQNQIMRRLREKVNDYDPDHLVAQKLSQSLETKKFLLLLDDVWDPVDLDSVGMPSPSIVGKDCKVVLTTRYRNVCHKMRTDEEVKVEVLSQEESWQLFRKEVGEVVNHPSIAPLAKGIVQECGGLPLAITTVGGALREEDNVHVWSNTLTELRSPATSWIEEMEEEVFKRLKFSYDRLKDGNMKKCFLYIALYPEDHMIKAKELIEYWRAEGFLDGARNLAQARDKGHSVLKKLIDSSLLREYPNAEFICVHDVLRDMSLRLTSTKGEECRFLARAGVGMEEPPIEDEWKEAKRISLMNNQLLGLPEKPECSVLSALLLQGNESLTAIPESFFKHMYALKVLDLSGTCIKTLPPSLGNLVNLNGLHLNNCRNLSDLPSQVGALKRLEALHLRSTNIQHEGLHRCHTRGIKFLPIEIGELTCLRRLEVSFSRYKVGNGIPVKDLMMAMTTDGIFSRSWIKEDDGSVLMLDDIDIGKPQMIPAGVLSKLFLLEELRIDVHPEDKRWNSSVAEAVMAVCSLKELTTLDFHFPRVEYLEHFIRSSQSWKRGLTEFRFLVGHHVAQGYFSYDTNEDERWNRCLIYEGGGSVSQAIVEVLSYADGFHIEGNNSIRELSEFGMENMNQLAFCFIRECNEMVYVINGTGVQESALPSLKNLFIWHLPKLRSIWEGPVQVGSLASLTVLHLTGCPMLQKVFSMDMVRQLSNLEDLFIRDCSSIEEILDDKEAERAVDYDDLLPNLWTLDLRDLPQLTRISKPTSLSWLSSPAIEVEDCPNLKSLPFDRQNAEQLHKILVGMNFLTPLKSVLEFLWEPVAQRIGYVKNLESNFEKLNDEARDLYNRRDDVKLEIRRSKTEKIPTNECKGWLEKVEKIENKLKEIAEEYKEDKKCLIGCCPDVFSSMKLGARVQNMISDVIDLKKKSKFEGGIVVNAPLVKAGMMLAPTIEIETSSDRTLKNIVRCIEDVGIKKIGIWGMGGVGKTTVMQNLRCHPKVTRMFEIVIWVAVSKDWSTRKVQNQIMRRLREKVIDYDPDHFVAQKLSQSLETKKFLLLLDDVWDPVDLDSLGIPSPSILDNDCKIVLTTRYPNVCHKMRTDEEVKVEVLSKEESWQLFRKEVGKVVEHPSIVPLAKGIVQECGGLPLVITTVGGALRKEDNVHVWSNTLTELRSPATSWIEEMDEEVFKRLKFSYDRLKDGNMKKCFLYIALYPEDHMINAKELIEYWRAEGFLDGARNLAQARDKGHSVLKKLTDSSLLREYPNAEFIRVHDVLRDMALRLTSTKGKECRFLARAGVGMEEPPIEDEWKEAKRISLMNNRLLGLLEKPECSMLSALLLQGNESLTAIPESFFKHMYALRVLDLSGTCIMTLPPSLGNLVNLNGLHLNNCRNLSGLPSQVGALKRLEALHLRCTNIQHEGLHRCHTSGIKFLPIEIGELTYLRRLEVSFSRYNVGNGIPVEDLMMAITTDGIFSGSWIREDDGSVVMLDDIDIDKPQMIPAGVLWKFSLLEELRIDVHPEDKRWNSSVAEAVMAVCSLKELTTLDFHFPRVEYLEHFIRSSQSWKRGLTAFRFSVGHHVAQGYFSYDTNENERWNRCLIYEGGGSVSHAVVEVLSHADGFHIEGNNTIQELSEFGMENMNQLALCFIRECNEMMHVINGTGIKESALPSLKNLFIWHLPRLRSIWEGPVQVGSLASLTVLHLTGCPMLRKVFSMDMVRQLSNLEDLFIRDCSSIEEIFDDKEVEMAVDYDDLMPKLWKLDIRDLPQLARISKRTSSSWRGLSTIVVEDCPNLKSLPFDGQNAKRLSRIHGEREWWNTLEWEDEGIKLRLLRKFYRLRPL